MTESILDLNWESLRSSLDGDERCGLVLNNLTIIELVNESTDPHNSFVISETQVLPFKTQLLGIWHTHPRGPANLSIDDYNAVLDLPRLHHLIISPKHVSMYSVIDGLVMNIARRPLHEHG